VASDSPTGGRQERPAVLIVEDDEPYARLFIAPHFRAHTAVHFAYNVPQALAALDELRDLALAIIDLDLPGGQPFDPTRPGGFGFEVVDKTRRCFPRATVVVLTGHLHATLVNTAQRLGAEYLVKDDCAESLHFMASRLLLETHPQGAEAEAFVARFRDEHALSPRQTQIVAVALRGLQNPEIAAELGISVNTLKRHINGILEKSGEANLASITRRFLRGG
jgi:DNA-binding NarL/FixJ family response regulator